MSIGWWYHMIAQVAKQKACQLKAANALTSKLSPVIAYLESLVSNDVFNLVAAPLADPIRAELAAFREILSACQAIIGGDHTPSVTLPDLKPIGHRTAAVKNGCRCELPHGANR